MERHGNIPNEVSNLSLHFPQDSTECTEINLKANSIYKTSIVLMYASVILMNKDSMLQPFHRQHKKIYSHQMNQFWEQEFLNV